jgi:hypothetical protein
MSDQPYRRAVALSQTIAAEVGEPRFYLERTREVALSRELFAAEPLIAAGLRMVEERGDCPGHGIGHVKKVAVDCGALILIWAMIIPRALPLQTLLPRFQPGLERIRKIRESFRTPTGRRYGPDFIDRGLVIGRRLHAALTENKGRERCWSD